MSENRCNKIYEKHFFFLENDDAYSKYAQFASVSVCVCVCVCVKETGFIRIIYVSVCVFESE